VADDPAGFAAAVVRTMRSAADRGALGTAARELVAEHYGAEPVARQFERICLDVVQAGAPAVAVG
jgi:hypothetical protein